LWFKLAEINPDKPLAVV